MRSRRTWAALARAARSICVSTLTKRRSSLAGKKLRFTFYAEAFALVFTALSQAQTPAASPSLSPTPAPKAPTATPTNNPWATPTWTPTWAPKSTDPPTSTFTYTPTRSGTRAPVPTATPTWTPIPPVTRASLGLLPTAYSNAWDRWDGFNWDISFSYYIGSILEKETSKANTDFLNP